MAKANYIIGRAKESGGFEIPSDNFIMVLKAGDWDNAEAGICQHVDQEAFDRILAAFKDQSAEPNFPGLLVDYDHFSHRPDRPSGAAAWIVDLKQRDDALWAEFRFTKSGRELVEGGEYRLTSPVLDRFEPYDGAPSEKHLRPGRLLRVGLTNDPNMKGLVPASNRTNPEENRMNHAEKLKKLLGLAQEASDDDIEQAIQALEADAAQDKGPNPDNDGDEHGAVENAEGDAYNRAGGEEFDSELDAELGQDGGETVLLNRYREREQLLMEQIETLNRQVAEGAAERYAHLFDADEDGTAARRALASLFAANREDAETVVGYLANRTQSVAINRGSTNGTKVPLATMKPLFNSRTRAVPPAAAANVAANRGPGNGATVNRDRAFYDAVGARAQDLITANRGMSMDAAWDAAISELEAGGGSGAAAGR